MGIPTAINTTCGAGSAYSFYRPMMAPMDCPILLGRGLDFLVPEVSVAQCHADIGMAEQTRDDRHRHAVHHRVARMGMAEVVKADILDVGLAADPMPE